MMKKLETIIIEDEKPARDLLRAYLEEYEQMEIIGEYDNGFEGLKAVNEKKPDVIFLDVQMPKLTGVEMLEVLEHVCDPVLAVSEAIRVSSQFIIASVPSKEDGNPQHIRHFSGREFENLFLSAGAKSVKINYVLKLSA